MQYFHIIIFIIFWYFSVFLTNVSGKFENISKQDGLSQSTVSAIYRDSQGFLWIGTGAGGLNRYDGYKFKIYQPDPSDTSSLSNSSIQFISEISCDNKKDLWIGTQAGGLNKFDRTSESFSKINFFPNNHVLNSIFDDLSMMCHDDQQNLWISSYSGGVLKYNILKGAVIVYQHKSGEANSLSSNKINYIYRDKAGFIWIGSIGSGLDCFDPTTGIFYHFRYDSKNLNSISNNYIWCIYEDASYNLWVGTKSGLNRLVLDEFYSYTKNNSLPLPGFFRYIHDPDKSNSLSGNWILSLIEDEKKTLWIGTYGGGVSCLNKERDYFTSYRHDANDDLSLSHNDVKIIYEDTTDNIIWIGTDGGGMDKYYYGQKKFEQFSHKPGSINSISGQAVYAVLQDTHHKLWIGTQSSGLDCFDLTKQSITNYKHNDNDPFSLPNNKVTDLLEDNLGRIWVGTMNGLARFDRNMNKFYNFQPPGSNQDPSSPNWVSFICKDPKEPDIFWLATEDGLIKFNYITGIFTPLTSELSIGGIQVMNLYSEIYINNYYLWVATAGNGLICVNTDNGSYEQYLFNPNNPYSISDDNINSVYRDKSGTLWIGTHSGGLNKLDNDQGKFLHYTVTNGLPDNYISSILEDGHGNIWLGTNKGLSRFDPSKESFINFNKLDGLLSDEFWPWTAFKDTDGKLYLGGPTGFIRFHPDSIHIKTNLPPVVFTDLLIFNKSTRPERNAPITSSITQNPDINITHEQNIFSLEFAALDYSIPEKIRYAYKMVGVDPDWVYTDASRRLATYTQLTPGEYTFKVKATNSDGIWNDIPNQVNILIIPPWWRTPWAYFVYLVVILLIIIALWQIRIDRIKNKHQIELQKIEREKSIEIDEAKSKFFTNISHEFRTPLSLIAGPVKQFLDGDLNGNLREHMKGVLKNTYSLLSLVNQLLEIAKLESGQVKLKASRQDLIPLLKGLAQSFESLAVKKNISFTLKTELKELDIFLDTEKFEKIINNLLSNAFKFTPEYGRIEVSVKLSISIPQLKNKSYIPSPQFPISDSAHVEISVSNTGSYLTRDQIDQIFDRYYQVYTGNTYSSGIGLALVKEYVELHSGSISAHSDPAQITKFVIFLPLGRNHLSEDEIVYDRDTASQNLKNLVYKDQSVNHKFIPERPIDSSYSRILIVEDNIDVRNYLAGILQPDYTIITADNGKKGLIRAHDDEPDLIISDVMMPEMDGYELCRCVKDDLETSHIPVILLTAMASQDEKYIGLNYGADDYIIKPFEARELRLKVQNILALKKRIFERFKQKAEFDINTSLMASTDRKFFQQLLEYANAQSGNSQLTILEVARAMNVSLPTLTRKIKAVVNMTPSEFIRTLRLKRAKELLQRNYGNISEIAFEVGFNSLSYFTRCYQKQFGITPSQELKSIRP